jgi:predicted RNA-binding Zn-ribbon protein involved in translation (DUF1610 family)
MAGNEVSAALRESCPACGAKTEWNPGKQALVCPFCGTATPVEQAPDSEEVREIDLATALREVDEQDRGWQAQKRSVKCQSCQAVSVFDAHRVAQNCEFCGSPALVPYEEIRSPVRPQGLLPFQVSSVQVRESIRKWYESLWFAPGELKRKALTDQMKGVYLPFWTFDAHVSCRWTAESGTYYYTTGTSRDSQGRTVQRQVRNTRWSPASGHLTHFFDDEPIPATRGVHARLLSGIQPFPTRDQLVPYDPKYISGFVVEHYQMVLLDAAKQARDSMRAQLRAMCAGEVPGDTHRNLVIYPVWSGETFKHILLPVWLLTYVYGRKSYQVAVNGYTGKMSGEYPKSTWKILLVVLLVLVAVAVIVLLRS